MNKNFCKNSLCLCGSGSIYKDCCQQYHEGILPKNALTLMRSRYTAYALDLVNYIIETTHADHTNFLLDRKKWAEQIHEFAIHTKFEKLEILDIEEGDKQATVTFVAYLKCHHQDATFTEKSLFKKVNDRWFYVDGKLAHGKLTKKLAKRL